MSKKYHINPETKEVGLCSANIQCRFSDDDGIEPQHYENVYEAHEEAERQLNETHGSFSTIGKYNSAKFDNKIELPVSHTFEILTKTERNWKTPEEHFDIGNIIRYEGDIHTINDMESNYNYSENEYDYHIYTDDGRDIIISEWSWKHSDNLELEKLTYDYDEIPVPSGSSGAKLSDYVNLGDTIKYNDELYIVEDFEYNRALLAYEIKTDQGTIHIDDDDWYHNASPNIFVQRDLDY